MQRASSRAPSLRQAPDNGLVRAARAAGAARASSAQRSLAVAIFLLALIDMSNGPKTPLSPATCICSATGAAAGRRRPGRHAAGGTEPGAAHRGRAGPRRLPRRRRGGQRAPPCGRGSSRAANVTRRRRLTHPLGRSRAASRAGRPVTGPRDCAPGSRERGAPGPEGACVLTCQLARPLAPVARRGSAGARRLRHSPQS